MKKFYQKPAFMMENFVLSENIASCSESYGNHMDWLAAINGKWNYFVADSGLVCTSEPPENFEFDQLCYHTSARNVFSS